MNATLARVLASCALVGLGGSFGCGVFESRDGKGTSQLSSAEPLDGAAPATVKDCNGLPGPAMVALQAPNGTKYCIDSTEVTQAQYAEFLGKVTAKPSTEHEGCEYNETYAPKALPIDPIEPKICESDSWTPDKTPNRPVVCIDWCDAYAYCAWAGKRLCGRVGGGSVSASPGVGNQPDPNDPAKDPTISQWYNACSQGGKTAYPYGDTYDPTACEGHDATKDPSVTSGHEPLADVASYARCRGGAAPYSNIADLSGSVDEFTDECLVHPESGTLCAIRGGNLATDSAGLTCANYGAVTRGREEEILGVRCCKDLD